MKYNVITLDESASTNTTLKEMLCDHPSLPAGTVVTARTQSQGRGQRGNSWESAPGRNITLSMLVRPCLSSCFVTYDISIITSLAISDLLKELLPHYADKVKIKWPNDIYVDDYKIAGILIENDWMSTRLNASIVGIGLNVNQEQFVSNAPNPISIAQLSERSDYDLEQLQARLLTLFQERYQAMERDSDEQRQCYYTTLYRADGGEYRFMLPNGDSFTATIVGVTLDGHLMLSHALNKELHAYAFKEIAYVL